MILLEQGADCTLANTAGHTAETGIGGKERLYNHAAALTDALTETECKQALGWIGEATFDRADLTVRGIGTKKRLLEVYNVGLQDLLADLMKRD